MRSIGRMICASVFLLSISPSAVRAQGVGASGDIRGTVTDSSGAAASQAKVTVVNVEKEILRTAGTDEKGEYQIAGLMPAVYDVSVELRGFQPQVHKGVVVTVGETVIVGFQLKVSTMITQFVVTGESPLIETDKTQQANTIHEFYIRQLPIDRRDYLTYALLMPGISDSNALADNTDFRVTQTPQSGLSFYGSNGRGNNVTVDGAEANDDAGGVRLTLTQEAVQEFQVNRSNYSAEFGGASGGVINIVSKSGTNQIHGSAFGFFRHDALDARDPFAVSSALAPGGPFVIGAKGKEVKPPSNRQQFGGTVGFPIRKDRTFAFLAYEGLRRDESAAVPVLTNSSIFAPTTAQAGILNSLQAQGSTSVPCLSNPATSLPASTCAFVLNQILTIDPTTSGSPETPFMALSEPYLVNLFINNSGIFPFTARSDLVSGRLDHYLNDQNQVFLRYNFGRSRERNAELRALVGFSRGNLIKQWDSTAVLGWYRRFGAGAQNEARAQWNYYTFGVSPNDPGGPQLDLPGYGFFNRDIFLPSFTTYRRYEFADNFMLFSGRKKMKFGGYLLLRGTNAESHTLFPGRFSFGSLPGILLSPQLSGTTLDALQAFKLGLPQFYQQGFGSPTVKNTNPLLAFYWQDNWRPWQNLTVNYGLRYELDKRYAPLRTDKNNFGPRFGFSWDPLRDHKTVVRGGYGIFYSPIYYQIDYVVRALGVVNGFRQIAQVFVPLTGAPGIPGLNSAVIFQTLMAQGKIGCGNPVAEACITANDLTQFNIGITHEGPIPALSVIFGGSRDYVNPYSQQASFGIERELMPKLSISVDYIYSRALKVTRARDKNLLPTAPIGPLGIRQWNAPPCTTSPTSCFVNPLILQDNVYESTGRAFYDGFLLSMNKRFSHNMTLFGNYTFSKAIDEVTDFNSDFAANDQTNLRAERALSAFDERHKSAVGGVLQTPWQGGAGTSLLNRFFSGFSLSPIFRTNSGRPFNLLVGADVNGDRHATTDRPPGAPRNTGRGPSYWDFDVRVTREVALGEKRKLEVVFEAFNLFNQLNFSSINNTVGLIGPPFELSGRRDLSPSQSLGFTAVFPRRTLQLGVRLDF